jgi:HD-GYP domain-containing protein (c-di-GMP phosphodiesterase class II)
MNAYDAIHGGSVGVFASLLAPACGVDPYHAFVAGWWHDCGKWHLGAKMLEKPMGLSRSEREIIELHPILGVRYAQRFLRDSAILYAIEHHHERYDGSGYPYGIRLRDPLTLCVALADTYVAMLEQRPYTRARTADEALDVIAREGEGLFGPTVTAAACGILKRHDLSGLACLCWPNARWDGLPADESREEDRSHLVRPNRYG